MRILARSFVTLEVVKIVDKIVDNLWKLIHIPDTICAVHIWARWRKIAYSKPGLFERITVCKASMMFAK